MLLVIYLPEQSRERAESNTLKEFCDYCRRGNSYGLVNNIVGGRSILTMKTVMDTLMKTNKPTTAQTSPPPLFQLQSG